VNEDISSKWSGGTEPFYQCEWQATAESCLACSEAILSPEPSCYPTRAFKDFWYYQVLSSALFSSGRESVELSTCLKVTFLIDNLGELPVVKGALQYSSAATWDSTAMIS